MKKPELAAVLAVLAMAGAPLHAQQPAAPAKTPTTLQATPAKTPTTLQAAPAKTPTALQPATPAKALTAEQKLAKLTPAERAEFEKQAKILGLDAKQLAAKDHETAKQDLRAASERRITKQDLPAGKGKSTGGPTDAEKSKMVQDAMKTRQEAIDGMNETMRKLFETSSGPR